MYVCMYVIFRVLFFSFFFFGRAVESGGEEVIVCFQYIYIISLSRMFVWNAKIR